MQNVTEMFQHKIYHFQSRQPNQTLPIPDYIKGRVSRFSACASDDLSAVKIIVFRPIRSAFTTLAGYGGKLL